jgi:exonuclease VII small subunit
VLAGVDPAKPVLEQGVQLVESCATALDNVRAEIPKLRRT